MSADCEAKVLIRVPSAPCHNNNSRKQCLTHARTHPLVGHDFKDHVYLFYLLLDHLRRRLTFAAAPVELCARGWTDSCCCVVLARRLDCLAWCMLWVNAASVTTHSQHGKWHSGRQHTPPATSRQAWLRGLL